MVKIPPWLYSSFKEISNDTSHAQIRVQTKKLCYQQIGEENKSLRRFCHDRVSDKTFLQKNPDFVATELATNSVSTKLRFCRNKGSNKLCHDKLIFCLDRVRNKICRDKLRFCLNKVRNKLCGDKTRFCCDRVSNKLCCNKTRFCRDRTSYKLCCIKTRFCRDRA